MLSAFQQVQQQQERRPERQQPVPKHLLRQGQRQPVPKRLLQPEPERGQQPELEQQPELLRVFHRRRSEREPTEQQQERRVSLFSSSGVLSWKNAKPFARFPMHRKHIRNRGGAFYTGGHKKSRVPAIFCYNPNRVVDTPGRDATHISMKRDFRVRAFSGSCCARMPRGSSKWKRRT